MLLKILGVSDFSNFSSRSGDRTGEKQMSKFIPGQSGNPNGRPRGTGVVAKLREAIQGDIPDVIQSVVEAAKSGDMTAAKILLDRVVPSLKPVDAPVVLNQAAELSSSGREVLQLLSDGQLGIDQAKRILRALGSQRDLIEFDDLVKRLEVLERDG
jgi:hypothetical protein